MYERVVPAPWGKVGIIGTESGLVRLELNACSLDNEQLNCPEWLDGCFQLLKQYLRGEQVNLEKIPIDWQGLKGTVFQKRVWKACQSIGRGQVRSYGWLAEEIGCSKGFQAVGQALGKNPVAIFIPCHRVVAKNGIGGFSSGLEVKKILLALEGIEV